MNKEIVMREKVLAAKKALEELVEEVQKHHNLEGQGSSKNVLIELDLDYDVSDVLTIFKSDTTGAKGLLVSSVDYDDWIDVSEG